jgi:hypothetical protein
MKVDKDARICTVCNEETDINTCWYNEGDYYCNDDCVPREYWVKVFGVDYVEE